MKELEPIINIDTTDRDCMDECFAMQRKHGLKSVWSIYPMYTELFDEVALVEPTQLHYSVHWGDHPCVIDLPANATWLDLWKAAEKIIKESGDNHHIFIEGFCYNKGLLELCTGS